MTEAIARYGKSQGDQIARHPKLLNRGEPTGRKDDRETHPKPPLVEVTIPTRRKQANTAKARLRKPTPGEQIQENRTFLNLHAFRRVKAVTTGGTENGLKKEERHGKDDSAYDQAQREPVLSHNLQENSQAIFFQLDTTTPGRNQPVKRRSVLRQAPRGRGKRRPAQAR